MFYYIAKIVWFFLTPSNALVTAALAGLLLMRTKRMRLGQRMAFGSVALLLVAGLSPLATNPEASARSESGKRHHNLNAGDDLRP